MDAPMVMIEWLEAYGCAEDWRDLATIKNDRPLICKSVGWMIDPGGDADCVTIIPHITTGDHDNITPQACGDMTIPKRAIIKTTILTHSVAAEAT